MTRKQPRMQGSRPPTKLVLSEAANTRHILCLHCTITSEEDDHINLSNEVVEVDKAGAEIKHSEKAGRGWCPVSSLTS